MKKKTERNESVALRRSEELVRTIAENSTQALIMMDERGYCTYANRAWLAMTGYSAEEIRSKPLHDLVHHHYHDGRPYAMDDCPLDRALPENFDVRAHEDLFFRKDGTTFPVLCAASPIFKDGRPVATVLEVRDVTEQKRAEQALRELNATLESKVAQRTAELERRTRQLQTLAMELSRAEDRERKRIATILHEDLQQHIAGAKFHLSLLNNRHAQDPKQQATLARVDEMLREAIEKSRGLSHELSPAVLHRNDLAEALHWLAAQMQEKHGLTVNVNAGEEMRLHSEALTVFLFRTAQELLFNTLRHARVREARLRVRRRGQYVCLSVSDRGLGFDPRDLPESMGFGLLSIRERIELLGGRMKIRSAPGQGSRFHVIVPDEEPIAIHVPSRQDPAGRPKADTSAPPANGRRLRVLLVDDHDIVREGIASLLAEAGDMEVVGEAANGREAVDQAVRLAPDVVIMDVLMPLMNGDEATRRIKVHVPETRIIALSMLQEERIVQRMHQAGADRYVLKTAPSDELFAAIRGKHRG